jgi:hypothetical protein
LTWYDELNCDKKSLQTIDLLRASRRENLPKLTAVEALAGHLLWLGTLAREMTRLTAAREEISNVVR